MCIPCHQEVDMNRRNELFKNIFSRDFDPNPASFDHKKEIEKITRLVTGKKYDRALNSCRVMLQSFPDQFHILYLMGKIYFLKEKFQNSKMYFEKVLQYLNLDNNIKNYYSPYPEKVFKNSLFMISSIIIKHE
jgi:tetratricopeptide (TPR) repeat protein